ncbi:hypothetical protein LR48_Vigan06g085400 [Vigna angularis]|uniref:Uncharacterized protein n=1 Tax=Phaseolus angularis TaxID=3914 RepID=A0A0L9US28_PHAAN|nr:hypothetical protein LR48_Vigan06g085400 [Vigna angularis]
MMLATATTRWFRCWRRDWMQSRRLVFCRGKGCLQWSHGGAALWSDDVARGGGWAVWVVMVARGRTRDGGCGNEENDEVDGTILRRLVDGETLCGLRRVTEGLRLWFGVGCREAREEEDGGWRRGCLDLRRGGAMMMAAMTHGLAEAEWRLGFQWVEDDAHVLGLRWRVLIGSLVSARISGVASSEWFNLLVVDCHVT